MNPRIWQLMALVLTAVLTGCATSRSEIRLEPPSASLPNAATQTTSTQSVWIRSIVDDRQFAEAPRDPSIPSLGFEGATQATPEIKARAFGRKRGGFGKALGDVLLENGQTVSSVIRDQLSASFAHAGYRVTTSEKEVGTDPLIVDVRIRQFWAWINMGFWALTLNNQITTDLTLSGNVPPITVSVHMQEPHMAITDGAWTEDLGKALQAYRAQATEKVKKLPVTP